jgi:competence protein ComEA
MASRPSRAEHEAILERRLGQLSAELVGDPAECAAPAVPLPGRHAARRPGGVAAGMVPEPLRGRVALGPSHLAVVAVLVALGLAATAWWVIRSAPEPVTPVAVPSAPAPDLVTGPAGDGTPTGAGDEQTVTVDVAGKVRRPGIAVLDAGARVVDALRAAGGARPGVDLGGLNLARVLVDGEQIVVGIPAPSVALPSVAASSSGALVNINTADVVELETLPEVGPVTAQAIISWRDEHGGFTSVEELLEVDGIGEATLEAMAPFVTV